MIKKEWEEEEEIDGKEEKGRRGERRRQAI